MILQMMNTELRIDGLDTAEGIRNCGSETLFLNLLGDFYKLIDVKSEKIEEYLSTGQFREYTIEVHGLKNTARMIGALELSDLFSQMEHFGNAKAYGEIRQRTPTRYLTKRKTDFTRKRLLWSNV